MPRLTKRLIDHTRCPEYGQVFLRDDELSGFAIRLTKGQKSFILEKRINGRVRRQTIGPYGPLTLDQARQRAKMLIGRIAAGEDPAQERGDKIQELTVGDLWSRYETDHLPRKRPNSARNDRTLYRVHLKTFQNWKLSAVKRPYIIRLHTDIGKTRSTQANRIVDLLRKMFNLADVWGLYKGENPATKIEKFKEKKRDRFVKPEELPALWREIKAEPNEFIRAAFVVAMFTGARSDEVLSMRWADIDASGVWRIPETKPGRPHLIPLPVPILTLLDSLPRYEGNPWVFPSRQYGKHLINVSKAWRRIRKAAKLDDVTIHDLRRTLGSWLVGSGVSLPLIGKVLNHTQPQTTAIYARLDLEPVRIALEENAKKMLMIAEKGNGQKEDTTQRDETLNPL